MKTELHDINREKDIVKVILFAKRDSKYSSLENTAIKHFMEWQNANYNRLKYKSSKIVGAETKESDVEGMYYYILIIKLKGMPK